METILLQYGIVFSRHGRSLKTHLLDLVKSSSELNQPHRDLQQQFRTIEALQTSGLSFEHCAHLFV